MKRNTIEVKQKKMTARKCRSLSLEMEDKSALSNLKETRSVRYKKTVEEIEIIVESSKGTTEKEQEETEQTENSRRFTYNSIRSWFSLVANESNRPSIFSKLSR